MATKKKVMGRPKLSAEEKKERASRTRVSLMLNTWQYALLQDWIEKDSLTKTKPMNVKDAVTHLLMSRLTHDKEGLIPKEELDKRAVSQGWKSKRK